MDEIEFRCQVSRKTDIGVATFSTDPVKKLGKHKKTWKSKRQKGREQNDGRATQATVAGGAH